MTSFLKLLIILWILPIGSCLHAQQVISSGGDHHEKASGSISFTVGEIAIETCTKTNNILTQGFHQTHLVAVTINELTGLDFKISVFPNPTMDYILLKIPSEKVTGMHYKLYDMYGKLLQNKLLEGTETEIYFSDPAPSIYFIKIIEGNREIKTFKILKQ